MTKPSFPNIQDISTKDNLEWKMTSNGRLPKTAKFEYLSNHCFDLSRILNYGFYDQIKLSDVQNILNEDDLEWKMTSNRRLPKTAKFEYLSKHWSDLSQILNLDSCDQTKL